jgi:hypothetical protein
MTKNSDSYYKTLRLTVGDDDRTIRTVIFYPFQSRKSIVNGNNTLYNQEGAMDYLERERNNWYKSGQFGDQVLNIKE